MSDEQNLRGVETSLIVGELRRRVAHGEVEASTALTLVTGLLDQADKNLEKERRKAIDIETALSAALMKPSRKFGDLSRLEFISEKLKPYNGHLWAMTDKVVEVLLEKEK